MSQNDNTAAEFLYYNRWANLKLIDALHELPSHQLESAVPGSYGSIYNTLEHIVRAEALYYRRLTGIRLKPPFTWEDRPSLTQIRPYAEQVSSALFEVSDELSRADRVVEEREENEVWRYKALTLLIQTVNHGVEHRTNITTILAQLGFPPPEIDGWAYMESNLDRLGA